MNEDDMAIQAELLDDFYAECDEHLSNVRAQLLAAENAATAGQFDRAAIDSCFRSMHSFKGNAAIVGLRSAEELAHASETLLREFLRTEKADVDGLHQFGAAAQRLEQVVSAHRLKLPLPEIADVLAALTAHAPSAAPRPMEAPAPAAPAAPAASPAERLAEAQQRGLRPWRCTFSPSAELDRRGVNINTVRTRLGALGEIVAATPSIGSDGSMRFEFLLALRENPAEPDVWLAEGMRLDPGGPEAAAAHALPREGPRPVATGSSGLFISPSHIVRVDLSRLDDLMRITGEMVIHRSRLEERIARMSGDRSSLQEVNLALGRSLRELREALTRVRLVSIAEIFTRMPFVVRDLARDSDKRVHLQLEGQHTEIDKYLVERLKEPLLHLVRNAISHGIEPPAVRAAARKPETATLLLRAEAVGHSVVIQIRDDGRGVDRAAVAARAASMGIALSDAQDDDAILDVLCQPGFSTRDEADRVAGRGVGMAVVQSTIRELGGTLSLESTPGRGTQFTIRLPLTLSIAETFIVAAAEHTCAIPQEFVQEVMPLASSQVTLIHGVEVVPYRDGVLPLVRLRTWLHSDAGSASGSPTLVLNTDRGVVGLVVDRVFGRREVVVRAINDPLIQVPGVSGATELGDGHPVLILDPTALASRITRASVRAILTAGARAAAGSTA